MTALGPTGMEPGLKEAMGEARVVVRLLVPPIGRFFAADRVSLEALEVVLWWVLALIFAMDGEAERRCGRKGALHSDRG